MKKLLFLFLFISFNCFAATVNITPDYSNFGFYNGILDSSNPDTWYSTNTHPLTVLGSEDGGKQIVLTFDFNSIPTNSVVNSAILNLTEYQDSFTTSESLSVYEVLHKRYPIPSMIYVPTWNKYFNSGSSLYWNFDGLLPWEYHTHTDDAISIGYSEGSFGSENVTDFDISTSIENIYIPSAITILIKINNIFSDASFNNFDHPPYIAIDYTSGTANTPTYTFTNTPTWTGTPVPTNTHTFTWTNTYTPTFTFTKTNTPTFTITDTPTNTGTRTFTPTNTSLFTKTPTNTGTDTQTPTVTITPGGPTLTFTPTPSFTPTHTRTPTVTVRPTASDQVFVPGPNGVPKPQNIADIIQKYSQNNINTLSNLYVDTVVLDGSNQIKEDKDSFIQGDNFKIAALKYNNNLMSFNDSLFISPDSLIIGPNSLDSQQLKIGTFNLKQSTNFLSSLLYHNNIQKVSLTDTLIELSGAIKLSGLTAGYLKSDSDGDISVLNETYSLSSHTHDYSGTFAPLSHNHSGNDITSGTVADGYISSTIARDSEVPGLITGALSNNVTTNLTADRALQSNASTGKIEVSPDISTTELSYLNNATGNIQTQLNGKEPTLTKNALTASAPLSLNNTIQIIGAATTLSLPKATASVDGYLDNTDFSAFNGKQSAITGSTNNTLRFSGTNTLSESSVLTNDGTNLVTTGNLNKTLINTTTSLGSSTATSWWKIGEFTVAYDNSGSREFMIIEAELGSWNGSQQQYVKIELFQRSGMYYTYTSSIPNSRTYMDDSRIEIYYDSGTKKHAVYVKHTNGAYSSIGISAIGSLYTTLYPTVSWSTDTPGGVCVFDTYNTPPTSSIGNQALATDAVTTNTGNMGIGAIPDSTAKLYIYNDDSTYGLKVSGKSYFTDSLLLNNLTASEAIALDANKNIVNVAGVSATELGYLSTLTSNAQDQINGKEPTLTKNALTATSPLSLSAGVTVIGAGAALSLPKADTTNSGYLHTDDWDLFNGKYTPSGTANQTLYFSGTNTLAASSVIQNDNSTVGIGTSPNASYKFYSLASGSSGPDYAGYFENTKTENSIQYAGYFKTSGTHTSANSVGIGSEAYGSTFRNIGAAVSVSGSTGSDNTGIDITNSNSYNTNQYGVKVTSNSVGGNSRSVYVTNSATSSTLNAGYQAVLTGAAPTNYGVYSNVTGATTNWALYTAAGDTNLYGKLQLTDSAQQISVNTTNNTINFGSATYPNQVVFDTDGFFDFNSEDGNYFVRINPINSGYEYMLVGGDAFPGSAYGTLEVASSASYGILTQINPTAGAGSSHYAASYSSSEGVTGTGNYNMGVKGEAKNSQGTNIGVYGITPGNNGVPNYGVYGRSYYGSANYGVYGYVSGATGSGSAGYFSNGITSEITQHGVFADCSGSHGTGHNRGIYSRARYSTVENYGGYFITEGTVGTNRGIYCANTSTTAATSQYSGHFSITGAGPTNNYGVYITASGATNNYGLYVNAGTNYFAETIKANYLTASEALATDANKNIVSVAGVSATELGYLSSVTSDIQTQINGKQASLTGTTNNTLYFSGTNTISQSSVLTNDGTNLTTTGNIYMATDRAVKTEIIKAVDSTGIIFRDADNNNIVTMNDNNSITTGTINVVDTGQTITANTTNNTILIGSSKVSVDADDGNIVVTSTGDTSLDITQSETTVTEVTGIKVAATGAHEGVGHFNMGIKSTVSGSTSNTGIWGVIEGSVGYSTSGAFTNSNTSAEDQRGVYAYTSGSNGSSTHYGIYAAASGGGTNWAAYFGAGNVSIQNKLNFGTGTQLTISAGDAITVTQSRHSVTCSTGSDALTTINGGSNGDIIYLKGTSGKTITVTDTTGNIECNANFVLDGANDYACFLFDGTDWILQYKSLDN